MPAVLAPGFASSKPRYFLQLFCMQAGLLLFLGAIKIIAARARITWAGGLKCFQIQMKT
jgi:hypothetical protein